MRAADHMSCGRHGGRSRGTPRSSAAQNATTRVASLYVDIGEVPEALTDVYIHPAPRVPVWADIYMTSCTQHAGRCRGALSNNSLLSLVHTVICIEWIPAYPLPNNQLTCNKQGPEHTLVYNTHTSHTSGHVLFGFCRNAKEEARRRRGVGRFATHSIWPMRAVKQGPQLRFGKFGLCLTSPIIISMTETASRACASPTLVLAVE